MALSVGGSKGSVWCVAGGGRGGAQEIAASWALEGIAMTEDDAERAGRMIASHVGYEQVAQDIRARNQQH